MYYGYTIAVVIKIQCTSIVVIQEFEVKQIDLDGCLQEYDWYHHLL